MKRTIIIGAACALAGGAATASGAVSHIVGHEGPQVKLDAMCRRAVTPAPGESLEMSVNVIGQQVHCLIRRPDPFARCVKHLGPTPAVKIVRKDDWVGVKQLRDYVAALGACSKARLV